MKSWYMIISALLAGLGVCGLELLLVICNQSLTGGIIFIPAAYVIYIAYGSVFKNRNTLGLNILAGILALIYAGMFVFGMQFDVLSNVNFAGLSCLSVLLFFAGIFPFVRLLLTWMDGLQISTRKNTLVLKRCFFVLLITWWIAYMALFPGEYGVDAPYWHFEFSNPDIPISSQWSPIYCGLWYMFVHFGEVTLNSSILGFAIFSALQMSITLYVIWKVLEFIAEHLNEKYVIGVTVFFMVPTHVILALTSAQDALFSACFGMSVLYILKYLLNSNGFRDHKTNSFKMIFWLLLMCLVRNNGLYAMLVMMVIVLFVKNTRRLLLPLAAVVVLALFVQNPVYNIMGVEKGTAIREMLSLPLQQMGYVYNYSDRLTDEQKQEMQIYISDEGWKTYEPCISDHVKGQLNIDAVRNDMPGFLKLYLECFLSDPKGYLQAAGLQTFCLWYPNKIWPDYRPWHPYIDILCSDTASLYDGGFTIQRKSLLPVYELCLKLLYGYGTPGDGYGGNLKVYFTRVPVLNELCQAGTYTWILIFEFMYAIYKRNRSLIVIISLEFGLWLTVLLSPVIMYRYCAPFIFTAPLYVSAMIMLKKSKID